MSADKVVVMSRTRAGWSVALCGAALSVGSWLPWLTTSADGGGRASAIGGTLGSLVLPPRFGAGQLIVLLSSVLLVLGAMVGRSIAPRLAAGAAVVISALVGILTWWFYSANVTGEVVAAYGLYLGGVCAAAALGCSVWAFGAASLEAEPRSVPRR